jgi:hypothetical protein
MPKQRRGWPVPVADLFVFVLVLTFVVGVLVWARPLVMW